MKIETVVSFDNIVRPLIAIYLVIFTTLFIAWVYYNGGDFSDVPQWLIWMTTGTTLWHFGVKTYFEKKSMDKSMREQG